MALDYGMNAKHSNEGINMNLMVYLSSDYHLMKTRPDLPIGMIASIGGDSTFTI
jgi:hypothetical protein